jgi:hypothetical protein
LYIPAGIYDIKSEQHVKRALKMKVAAYFAEKPFPLVKDWGR